MKPSSADGTAGDLDAELAEHIEGDWPRLYRYSAWGLTACYLGWFLWHFGGTSLWIDEIITAWVTSSDLPECIQRARDFQGQSPLYFVIVWFVRQGLGDSEIALRSVSILSVIGSVFVFRALLKEAEIHKDAWIAPLVLAVAMFTDYQVGLNARPYAIAIFCSLLSLYCLLRWLRTRSSPMWIAYAAATSLTIIFHYLFASMVALHLAVVAQRARKDRQCVLRWMGAMCVVGVCLLPFVPHLEAISRKASRYVISLPPTLESTFENLFMTSGIWQILLVTAALCLIRIRRLNFESVDRRTASLGAFWWTIGPLSILALYYCSGMILNVPRYYSWRLPAVGLLAITSLQLVYAFRFAALPVILILGYVIPSVQHLDRSSWREAVDWGGRYTAREENYEAVVYSGLIETAVPEWVENERFRDYLVAPLLHYGGSDDGHVLPILLPLSQDFFEQKLDELTTRHDRLVFFLYRSPDASEEVREQLNQSGFEIVNGRTFRFVEVIVARRAAEES